MWWEPMREPFEKPSRNTNRNPSATDTAVPCMSCWTPRILISPQIFRADTTSSLKYQIRLLLPEEVRNQICMQVLIFKERISFMSFCFCLQRSVLWPHQNSCLGWPIWSFVFVLIGSGNCIVVSRTCQFSCWGPCGQSQGFQWTILNEIGHHKSQGPKWGWVLYSIDMGSFFMSKVTGSKARLECQFLLTANWLSNHLCITVLSCCAFLFFSFLNCKLENKISYYIFSLLDERRKEQFIKIWWDMGQQKRSW